MSTRSSAASAGYGPSCALSSGVGRPCQRLYDAVTPIASAARRPPARYQGTVPFSSTANALVLRQGEPKRAKTIYRCAPRAPRPRPRADWRRISPAATSRSDCRSDGVVRLSWHQRLISRGCPHPARFVWFFFLCAHRCLSPCTTAHAIVRQLVALSWAGPNCSPSRNCCFSAAGESPVGISRHVLGAMPGAPLRAPARTSRGVVVYDRAAAVRHELRDELPSQSDAC